MCSPVSYIFIKNFNTLSEILPWPMTHWPKAITNIKEPPLVAQNNKEIGGIEKQKNICRYSQNIPDHCGLMVF